MLSEETKKFFNWIRRQHCHFAGVLVDDPAYPKQCLVNWNLELGTPISEVSHILRRRSVRFKLGDENHLGNVFPNCRQHAQWFEFLLPEEREKYLDVGKMYLKLYEDEV